MASSGRTVSTGSLVKQQSKQVAIPTLRLIAGNIVSPAKQKVTEAKSKESGKFDQKN